MTTPAHCPVCGAEVSEVREAHRVGVSDPRPVRKPLVWPSGRTVLWPCGHDVPTRVVRLLASER